MFARSLCVFLLIVPATWAETPTIATPAALKTVHRVHSLADFGDDPQVGLWLAKTIGEVIAPGTWDKEADGEKRVLRYYAPGKILVVAHTAAVQAEVEAFLRSVKQSLPTSRPTAPPPILRMQNLVPGPPTELPAIEIPGKPAKHVFHLSIDGFENKTSDSGEGSEMKFRNFTLRYEGEGLFDLVEFAKNVNVKTETETPPPVPDLPAPKIEEPKIEHSKKPPTVLPPGAPNEEELLPVPMVAPRGPMACGVTLPGGLRFLPSSYEELPPPLRVPATPK
jgi:hypothetical protein